MNCRAGTQEAELWAGTNPGSKGFLYVRRQRGANIMMKNVLLFMIGVPIPVLILLNVLGYL